MTLTETLDTQFDEFARAYDTNVSKVADRIPPPIDVLVRRVGAVNAELIRQTGLVTITVVDATVGVVHVARNGARTLVDVTDQAIESSTDTLRTTGRRAAGDVKQATSTVANRARSAVDTVSRTVQSAGKKAADVGDRTLDEASEAADRVVKAVDTAAAETAAAGATRPSGPYQNWSKDELYERAQELDIDGRSAMSKGQLVKALRNA